MSAPETGAIPRTRRTIWKYALSELLSGAGVARIQMPAGAVVLSALMQHNTPAIWAEVDPDAATEERRFELFGTGHPMHTDPPAARRFIGTVMTASGNLVWHIYERRSP